MAAQGPTGREIVAISREHQLVGKPTYMIDTIPANGIGPVLEILQPHLEYWAEMEAKQILFAAGPVMPIDDSDPWSGEGHVIIRADSLEHATQIADADPMHQSGARTYTVRPWLLNHLSTDTLEAIETP